MVASQTITDGHNAVHAAQVVYLRPVDNPAGAN